MKSFTSFLVEATGDIGKKIGGSVYLHADYAKGHPRIPDHALDHAREVLKAHYPSHKFNVVRYGYTGKDKGSFSFIHSPDFNTSSEPISGNSVRIGADDSHKLTKQKSDPQIYHHKHEFVGNDYRGFDTEKSRERSKHYNAVLEKLKEKDPKIKSRMGTQSVWEKEVVPHL